MGEATDLARLRGQRLLDVTRQRLKGPRVTRRTEFPAAPLEDVTTMLLRLEQPQAYQFAFPEPIAARVEAVGPAGEVKFKDVLTSTQRITASVAGIAYAVTAPDLLGVFARQDTSVEFLANPVDQPGILSAHPHTDANTREPTETICA